MDVGFSGRLEFAPTQVFRFTGPRLAELPDWLKSQHDHTTVMPVNSPAELQLSPRNTTISGDCRYTRQAFSRLAGNLARGLGMAVCDIGGAFTSSRRRPSPCVDGMLARSVWNRFVEARFPAVRDYSLLRDEEERRIDGVLGASHVFISNHDFYRRLLDELPPRTKPFAAVVSGRLLSLWFRDPNLVRVGSMVCYPGYYYANSEYYGSMRGTRAFFTSYGVILCSYRRYGRRFSHGGRNTDQRVGDLAKLAGDAEDFDLNKMAQALRTASVSRLGFLGEDNEEDIAHKRIALVRELSVAGVPAHLTKEVVDTAMLYGADDPDGLPTSLTGPALAPRTWLDIFAVMLRHAAKMDVYRRERMELAVGSIIARRFREVENPIGVT